MTVKMLALSPGDENSTRQSGRVTYDFHSPVSFDTTKENRPAMMSPLSPNEIKLREAELQVRQHWR